MTVGELFGHVIASKSLVNKPNTRYIATYREKSPTQKGESKGRLTTCKAIFRTTRRESIISVTNTYTSKKYEGKRPMQG
jgi:hypothetical protein